TLIVLALGIIIGFAWANALVGTQFQQRVQYWYDKQELLEVVLLRDGELREFDQRVVVKDVDIPGDISLQVPKYPQYFAGDKLLANILLEQPESFEEFDYPTYLASQGIYYTGSATDVELVSRTSWL